MVDAGSIDKPLTSNPTILMTWLDAARTLFGPYRSPRARQSTAGPLRIAMAIETVGLGGAEVVVLQLAQELRRRGHEVFPIGPHGEDGWLRAEFVDDGFGWHTYELSKPIDWSCVVKYAELLRRLRANVVHAHEFVAAVYGAAATQLVGLPHVISMHGNQVMTEKLQRRVALRWAIARSQSTVGVSHATRRHLEASLGLPANRVSVVHNGIPDRKGSRDRVRAELEIRQDEILVIATGSLMKRKGHRILLEAMRLINTRNGTPSWRIAIAGEGAERAPLESFIVEHGLGSRVSLLGNRNDIPDIQAAADIFVMPSLWEGLPLAILEAMFASNPIIATAASGIPEAITHGQEGLLVPAGDSEAIAHALHGLLLDRTAREELGARARARAERQFSVRSMADAYEQLYWGRSGTGTTPEDVSTDNVPQ